MFLRSGAHHGSSCPCLPSVFFCCNQPSSICIYAGANRCLRCVKLPRQAAETQSLADDRHSALPKTLISTKVNGDDNCLSFISSSSSPTRDLPHEASSVPSPQSSVPSQNCSKLMQLPLRHSISRMEQGPTVPAGGAGGPVLPDQRFVFFLITLDGQWNSEIQLYLPMSTFPT